MKSEWGQNTRERSTYTWPYESKGNRFFFFKSIYLTPKKQNRKKTSKLRHNVYFQRLSVTKQDKIAGISKLFWLSSIFSMRWMQSWLMVFPIKYGLRKANISENKSALYINIFMPKIRFTFFVWSWLQSTYLLGIQHKKYYCTFFICTYNLLLTTHPILWRKCCRSS